MNYWRNDLIDQKVREGLSDDYGRVLERECVQHGGTVWLSPWLCDQSYEIAPGMRDACWSRSTKDGGNR